MMKNTVLRATELEVNIIIKLQEHTESMLQEAQTSMRKKMMALMRAEFSDNTIFNNSWLLKRPKIKSPLDLEPCLAKWAVKKRQDFFLELLAPVFLPNRLFTEVPL
jgi:hypothetical protein